jgi:S-formylglutathione hydrolase
MKIISEDACFGGVQGVYSHKSATCNCDMRFGLFLPKQAKTAKVPVLWYLSGLTCTHENAMVKAGAQAWAAARGMALVFPDTSPRGAGVADDDDFTLGQGAGFYVNATLDPWKKHYRMWDYVAQELPALVMAEFALDADRQAITGHSMGGHGALTLGMRLPEQYKSISAFAPLANPSGSDWGNAQFSAYLGDDRQAWQAHDASILMREHGHPQPVLVDQGAADQFLNLLQPEKLAEAMVARRQPGAFRMQTGYNHSYFFVASFMRDHVDFHAEALGL